MAEDALESHAWTGNCVVLDTVFAFLPLDDLRQARLTCKQFAKIGGRELAKRTVVCVTDSKFTLSKDFHKRRFAESFSFDNMWECQCLCLRYKCKRFISLDGPCFQKLLLWDSGFTVRNVDVLGYDSVCKLQQPMFSNIQNLQLIKIPFFQVSSLIQETPGLCPNLKHLAFKEIDVKARVPQGNLYTTRKLENVTPSQLESLTLEVSPLWAESDWMSVLQGHTKLKKLAINWFRNPAQNYHKAEDILQDKTSCFGGFLQKLLPSLPIIFAGVSNVTLRFELTASNACIAQDFLNEFNHHLSKLTLQLRGSFESSRNFIHGLKPSVSAALTSMHVVNEFGGTSQDMDNLAYLFLTLAECGMFRKMAWSFIIRAISRGWLRFIKTDKKFMIQTQGPGMTPTQLYPMIEQILGRQDYFPNNYNYAYHHIVGSYCKLGINDYENLNESTLFKSFFLRAGWRGLQHCICNACQDSPLYLADLPGFHQDAGHSFSNEHPSEFDVRTWTLLFVPRHILAKWKRRLVVAIARYRRYCRCAPMDFISRMKLGWHGKESFTNDQGILYPRTVLTHENVKKLAYMSCMDP